MLKSENFQVKSTVYKEVLDKYLNYKEKTNYSNKLLVN